MHHAGTSAVAVRPVAAMQETQLAVPVIIGRHRSTNLIISGAAPRILHHRAAVASFVHALRHSANVLSERRCRGFLDVVDAQRVDSVPLVGLSMAFPVEDVAEVRAAVVADGLKAAEILSHAHVADVACVVALVECLADTFRAVSVRAETRALAVESRRGKPHDPAAVIELRRGVVQRKVARPAREVALLREERVVLACAAARRSKVSPHHDRAPHQISLR
jgi:hypothetical protein